MSVRVAKDVDMSPLLPQDHHYSNLSPLLGMQRIEQGRREMMEMIQNLPELSNELSFKDIVNEKLCSQVQVDSVQFDCFASILVQFRNLISVVI